MAKVSLAKQTPNVRPIKPKKRKRINLKVPGFPWFILGIDEVGVPLMAAAVGKLSDIGTLIIMGAVFIGVIAVYVSLLISQLSNE